MLNTVFGDQMIESASRNHQNDTEHNDKVLIDFIKQWVPDPEFYKLICLHSKIKLFIVDDALATRAYPESVSDLRYFSYSFGSGMVFGILKGRRVFIWIEIASHRHVRLPWRVY